MKVYSGDGLGSFYYEIIRDITNHGRNVTVRGQRRVELKGPVVLEYNRPGACWMCIPGRKFNPFFMVAEIAWILGGMGNVEWIAYYNSKVKEIAADEGEEDFHGAYGVRLRRWPVWDSRHPSETALDQIRHVVRKLKADPFSTQAVMTLWDPVRDNLDKSKDYPCNNWVGYSLRDGLLEQSVVIRSNDIVLGQPHNAIQFTYLQAYVAGLLGVGMGKMTYFVQNLHYYQDLYPTVLGNLLGLAFGPQKGASIAPGAEVCSLFKPFDERELAAFLQLVERIRKDEYGSSEASGFEGHLKGTFSAMLWIFKALKEGFFEDAEDIKGLGKLVSQLEDPFPWLIRDFWLNSKNSRMAQVAELSR